jgi:hypothetical protein
MTQPEKSTHNSTHKKLAVSRIIGIKSSFIVSSLEKRKDPLNKEKGLKSLRG